MCKTSKFDCLCSRGNASTSASLNHPGASGSTKNHDNLLVGGDAQALTGSPAVQILQLATHRISHHGPPPHIEPAAGLLEGQSDAVGQTAHNLVQHPREGVGFVDEDLGPGQSQFCQETVGK